MALLVLVVLLVLGLGALSALAFALPAPIARAPLDEDLDDRADSIPPSTRSIVEHKPRVEVSSSDARVSDLVHLLRADRSAKCGEEHPSRWATSRSMATCPTCLADIAAPKVLAVAAGQRAAIEVSVTAIERRAL